MALATVIEPDTDPWHELAECTAEADALDAQLRDLQHRAGTTVAAIDATVTTLPVEHSATAHDALATIARLRHTAVTLQVAAVPLAERAEIRSSDGAKTARRWLAHHAGLSKNETNTIARASGAARCYPAVAEALDNAQITPAHASLIGGIIPARFTGEALEDAVARVRDTQHLIVSRARDLPITEFGEFCDRVRDLLDTDGPPDRSADPSRLTINQTFEGRWHLHGDLTPDLGAAIATLIENQIERTKRGHRTDTPDGSEPTEPTEPRRPHAELAADAVAQLLLAGAATGQAGRVGLYLHLDLADLLEGRRQIEDLVESSGNAHTELGLDITDDTLWALMCGGDIIPVLTLDGTPLSYGRTRRLAPEVLAHILRHRDRNCRFPTCDTPPLRLQNHHLIHWDDDGTTDPHNLDGPCRAHHADHHSRGWGIERLADGTLHFTRPDGTAFDATPRYRRRRSPYEE